MSSVRNSHASRLWPTLQPDRHPTHLQRPDSARVAELAAEIRRDFPDDLHFVAVLKGAFMFLSDLVRQHGRARRRSTSWRCRATPRARPARAKCGCSRTSTTPSTASNVVIVEDIVDTGLTLTYLQDILRARNPSRCGRRACSASRRGARSTCKVEYIGFTIEDRFVVGYGLDYAEQYRNLPSHRRPRRRLSATDRLRGPPLRQRDSASAMTAARSSVSTRRPASAPCR